MSNSLQVRLDKELFKIQSMRYYGSSSNALAEANVVVVSLINKNQDWNIADRSNPNATVLDNKSDVANTSVTFTNLDFGTYNIALQLENDAGVPATNLMYGYATIANVNNTATLTSAGPDSSMVFQLV